MYHRYIRKRSDSLLTEKDTNNPEITTFPPPPPPPPQSIEKRTATLGYSFFKHIQQHETRNINVYVSIQNALSKVIDTLKDMNSDLPPESRNDTATILYRNIFVYKTLDIHLSNAGDSNFLIKPLSEAHQDIDTGSGNTWQWAVTPRTNQLHGQLVLTIIAEKPDGRKQPLPVVTIPIDIIMNKHFDRTFGQWMMDNPEKVLTIILIPFIAFFWKQITGIFKKKSPPNTGTT